MYFLIFLVNFKILIVLISMNFLLFFGDTFLVYTTAASTFTDAIILFNMQRRSTQIQLVIQILLGIILIWIRTECPWWFFWQAYFQTSACCPFVNILRIISIWIEVFHLYLSWLIFILSHWWWHSLVTLFCGTLISRFEEINGTGIPWQYLNLLARWVDLLATSIWNN